MTQGRRLNINGTWHDIAGPPGLPLLELLRDRLGLTGAKESCGRGECGACTVLLDGRPVLSCITLADLVRGEVTTIEAVADENADLREAFADCGAFQCGFCTPGQIVRASALLKQPWPDDPSAREDFIRHEMSGNICRCTGYSGIVDAIVRTAAARGKIERGQP